MYKSFAAFLDLLINNFFIVFKNFIFIHIKVSKQSSAKYYQDKERLHKSLMKHIKLFLKNKKKNKNIGLNDIKNYFKIKSKI